MDTTLRYLVLFLLGSFTFFAHNMSAQSCGTAMFYAEDANNPGTEIPLSPHFCDDDLVVFWAEDDGTAGGFITPSLVWVFETDLWGGIDNEVFIYEDGQLVYYEDLAGNTTLTVTGQFLDPTAVYTVELCEYGGDGGVTYEVYDPICGTLIESGGAPFGFTGCLNLGPWNPFGSGEFTGPGIVASFEYGAAVWDPLEAGPGTHDITYCFSHSTCCNTCVTEQITVTNPYTADWNNPGPFCLGDASVDLNDYLDGSADTGGEWTGPGVTGSTFDPGTAGVGNHGVTYTVGFDPDNYPSCADEVTITINVEDEEDAAFSYPQSEYCTDEPNPTPTITGDPGGEFTSSPLGLVFVDIGTGEIDLNSSDEGTYIVTYTTSGTCPDSEDFEITIIETPDPSFSYSSLEYCTADPNPTPNSITTSGGQFSISGGGTINATTGEVDITATGEGEFDITYTFIGSCPADSTVTIEIIETQLAGFTYNQTEYCQNDDNPLPVFDTDATVGTFSAEPLGMDIDPNTGEIDLANSDPGTYTVTNTHPAVGDCDEVTADFEVTIHEWNNPNFNYNNTQYCTTGSNPTPNITTPGGEFTGDNGLIIDENTGEIDLFNSGPGTYEITYSFGGECPSSHTFNITINEQLDPGFAYSGPFCAGIEATALPSTPPDAGGTFSSTPVGLVFADNQTGEIDLENSSAGTYDVTYTLPSSGGCASTSSTASVTLLPPDDASFNYDDDTYCIVDNNPVPTITGLAGGAFSSTNPDLVVDEDTGEIDLSASQPGTYTITYETGGTCPNEETVEVTITPDIDAQITASQLEFCNDDDEFVFEASPSGGGWTSNTGVGFTDNGDGTATFDPTLAGSGSHTLTYEIEGLCGDTESVPVDVLQRANASINVSQTSFCLNDDEVDITYNQTGGSWSFPANGFTENADGSVTFNPTDAGVGTHNITYEITGTCGHSETIQLTVSPIPSAPSIDGDIFCIDELPIMLETNENDAVYNWYLDGDLDEELAIEYEFNPGTGGDIEVCATEISAEGCESDPGCAIFTIGNPIANFTADPNEGSIPLEVNFINNSQNASEFEWDFDNGETSDEENPEAITYLDWGNFTVTLTVTDQYGCTAEISQLINAITEVTLVIPNVFSPNGDGVNDVFKVRGTYIKNIEGQIFNRWGQEIATWSGFENGWDGYTSGGERASDGVYFYIIVATDMDDNTKVHQGSLNLFR